nr:hypothetical protein [Tanacetum cinerariifolium]
VDYVLTQLTNVLSPDARGRRIRQAKNFNPPRHSARNRTPTNKEEAVLPMLQACTKFVENFAEAYFSRAKFEGEPMTLLVKLVESTKHVDGGMLVYTTTDGSIDVHVEFGNAMITDRLRSERHVGKGKGEAQKNKC